MYSYAPDSDQEEIITHLSGEHQDAQDFQFQSYPPAHDQFFEGTEVTNNYPYVPQPHTPHFQHPSAGGVPPNLLVS
jgi:hypothetical protein